MIKTFFAQQVRRQAAEIVYVSVMPCVRKQAEADRDVPESHSAAPDDGAPLPLPAASPVHVRMLAFSSCIVAIILTRGRLWFVRCLSSEILCVPAARGVSPWAL